MTITRTDRKRESAAKCLGIDGCRGGWICAVLEGSSLVISRYRDISGILAAHGDFDTCLIDIPIGLQSSSAQRRPDSFARSLIPGRASTIFPVPCRQAVYADSVSGAYSENVRVVGKKFTPLTVGLLSKIREADEFLQKNPLYKERLMESHPEVCFRQLGGRTLLTRKISPEGQSERVALLQKYGAPLDAERVLTLSGELRCKPDDLLDACCLSVSASFVATGNMRVLPESPDRDDTGIPMRMVIPVVPDR